MEKKLVDRADVMVWKIKKGRVCHSSQLVENIMMFLKSEESRV